MKIKVFLIIFLTSLTVYCQQNTEVYLFDFSKNGASFSLNNPINISDNIGYDNQPSFLANGKSVLFASTRNGQTDVALYSIKNNTKRWLTHTEGSEYSPTQTPRKKYFTSILLEKNGTQLLWQYPFNKKKAKPAIQNLKIGYHAWYDKNTLFSFVLGNPATLQESNLKTSTNIIVANNIGRSIHKIPNTNLISFISFKENVAKIYSYNTNTKEKLFIVDALSPSQDMAWTPEGTIIMGTTYKLFKYKPGTDKYWVEFASLKPYNLNGITRIAISPKGDKIAIVVKGK